MHRGFFGIARYNNSARARARAPADRDRAPAAGHRARRRVAIGVAAKDSAGGAVGRSMEEFHVCVVGAGMSGICMGTYGDTPPYSIHVHCTALFAV